MRRKWWIVGILVLLELLVCAAILLTLRASRTTFEGIRFFYVADTYVEETIEKTFTVDGPAILDLEADFGDVAVTGSAGNNVEVIANLSLWGADEKDARQQVDVQMAQEGNRITIRVKRPEHVYAFASVKGSRVDFEIRVPSETSLQLVTSSGDLAVSDVSGAVELETDFGSIRAERVSGAVSAQSGSGDITLIDLGDAGDVQAETEFGNLVLRDIAADRLTARSGSGDIQVQNVTLDRLTADSDGGDIQVKGGMLESALDLETEFGDITAMDVEATACRLASGSGSLTLDGCDGPLDLETDFGDIEVRNATNAELAIMTGSGKIYFHGGLNAEGEHRLESDFGDIHVVLPADAAFDLDAETDFGSIETEFAVTVTEFEKDRLVGEINGGGPPLYIHTGSSDITLESATDRGD